MQSTHAVEKNTAKPAFLNYFFEDFGDGGTQDGVASPIQHLKDEFVYNDLNPLDADVILVDEMSMLDTNIFRYSFI